MKILQLASGDLWAGAEVQLFHLARALGDSEDVELLVVLLNHGQLEKSLLKLNIKVIVFSETELTTFSIFSKLNKAVKKFNPDIVHTHRDKENILGGLISFMNGKKSLRTVHGAPEFSKSILNIRGKVIDVLDRISAKYAQQKIVAVSEELKYKIVGNYNASKIVVINNCVDVDYIRNKSLEPCEINVDLEHYNIAIIGRLVAVKRIDLFCDIARHVILSERGEDIRFHIIGGGPLSAEIRDNINTLGLSEKIYFHGFVENTAPVLKKMDLLMITSDHEGLPMTLLEAMTLNVPVLSRDLATIKAVLCYGGCGYIFESDNTLAFAEKILEIAGNKTDASNKAKLAEKQILELYNIHKNKEAYMNLYESMLRECN